MKALAAVLVVLGCFVPNETYEPRAICFTSIRGLHVCVTRPAACGTDAECEALNRS